MALNASQLIQHFLQTIGRDIRLYQQLLELLKHQRVLYVTFDAEALKRNIADQQPLISELAASAKERHDCLNKLGVGGSRLGVTRLMNALPPALGQQAKNQWETLQRLVEHCQHYNNENGQTTATFHEMIASVIEPASDTYQERL
ncbi:flagellar protein FlgN [Enterovibrio nigricans]|uniref:Flagella synthesis protein FlgN n=1 Tax=Enterovibrio nigricans DSM 22720 TaxID=1121868 RepID=A0A1T4UKE5_9GAMM|nr:flagellar protein FlgN [Enterovibrio nigricans]PKF51208.1 flagellar protein FlgN [Enterovibrio nigricans]SKA53167.1 flagella synthesis protein FlgN [Enterovibrio nigricans DSM 22720]